ncbi:MAG: HD domain-containing protein [Clostridia bacterium]|nr:HD domain-containing protein [Clostridia bacterium]
MSEQQNPTIETNYQAYRSALEPLISPELIRFIDESDFRTAPASAKEQYHGCYEGGLCEHSLGVWRALRLLNSRILGDYYEQDTLTRVALLHDICKIGCYHPEWKNRPLRRDPDSGRVLEWETVRSWRFETDFPAGHGAKSVMLCLANGTPLSRDETLAITHHMGAYDLQGTALWDYQNASGSCPLVMITHWADLYESSVVPRMKELKGSAGT